MSMLGYENRRYRGSLAHVKTITLDISYVASEYVVQLELDNGLVCCRGITIGHANVIELRDISSTAAGKVVTTLGSSHRDEVFSVIQLKNGLLCSCSRDCTIRLWNPATAKCVETLRGHRRGVLSVGQLSNGQLCSGSYDHNIKIWDIETSKRKSFNWLGSITEAWLGSDSSVKTLSGHTNAVSCLLPLRNGLLCSGSWDHTIKLWNIDSGECMPTMSGHTDWVSVMVELSNGWLCSGSHDRTLKLWDVTNGQCIRTMSGHENCISSLIQFAGMRRLGVSDSGSEVEDRVVTCSASLDCAIKLWDIVTGTCVQTLLGSTSGAIHIIQLRSGMLCGSTRDKRIRLWELYEKVSSLLTELSVH